MSSGTSEKRIQTNGIEISYLEAGSGENTLIFIHGFPFNKSMWNGQLEALSKNNRIIAYDIRGFGSSGKGSEKISIDLFADDLIQFIDVLGLNKVIACGFSMGGYILMNAAARAPEKFTTIILADTQCIADSEEGKEKRFKSIEKINADGLTVFAEGYVKNVFAESSVRNQIEAVAHAKKMITTTAQESVTETIKALAERKETCNSLKNLKTRTLIICGREDSVTPLSQAELLNNAVSGSTLCIIENAGHMSNLENPQAFNNAIKNFLEGQ